MVEFNEKLPVWLSDGIEPPKTKQTEGWLVGDKPPAAWFNWLHTRTYKSIEELREVAKQLGVNIEEIDVTDELASLKTAIERKLKEIETSIEKVDNKANTNKSDITGLRTRVSVTERDISSLQTTKADTSYVDEQMAAAGKVDSVNGKAGAVILTASDINMSGGSSNSIYYEINRKANQNNLDSIDRQVNTNKADISKNTSNISINRNNINRNASDISTNRSNINKLENKLNNSLKIVTNKKIYSSDWSLLSGKYRARVNDSNITSASMVDVNIHLDSYDNAKGVLPMSQSYSGYFYMYSDRKPSGTITVDYKIIKEG